MESIISCPQCGRQVRITDDVVGRRVRCRECKTVFRAEAPTASRSSHLDDRDRNSDEAAGSKPSLTEIPVAIKRDPERTLKGAFKAVLKPGGMELRQGNKEPLWIPVGSAVEHAGKNLINVELGGRQLTLAVGRINLYCERLARDLSVYLRGGRTAPSAAQYVIPWYIVAAALLPVPMAGVFMAGGAIGGAVGGAYVGGLVALNLAIARKEDWSASARVGACVGLSAAGYLLFGFMLIALFKAGSNGQSTAWGTPEDPRGDCRITVRRSEATIELPGGVHDLTPPPGKLDAPRILRSVDPGDFVVDVKVAGDDLPTDPPATGAHISLLTDLSKRASRRSTHARFHSVCGLKTSTWEYRPDYDG